jgi:hypothetical protein
MSFVMFQDCETVRTTMGAGRAIYARIARRF